MLPVCVSRSDPPLALPPTYRCSGTDRSAVRPDDGQQLRCMRMPQYDFPSFRMQQEGLAKPSFKISPTEVGKVHDLYYTI